MQQRKPIAGILLLLAAIAGLVMVLLSGGVSVTALVNSWYLTRALGLLAYVLLWASLCLGILQSSGFLKGATSPVANLDLHEFLSTAALYTTVFHVVILLWDRYVTFTPTDLLIPFAGSYKPGLVGIGVVAMYITAMAIVTTYLRGHMSPKVWRWLHLTSIIGFALALAHGLLIGTDSTAPAIGFMYRFTGMSASALLIYRTVLGVKRNADSARRG